MAIQHFHKLQEQVKKKLLSFCSKVMLMSMQGMKMVLQVNVIFFVKLEALFVLSWLHLNSWIIILFVH